MISSSKNILFCLILISLFCLSYARDTLFILINAHVINEPFNYANTTIPAFVKQLSISDLNKLKWLMAISFAAAFMLITTAAIHFYFRNKQFTRLTIMLYGVLGLFTLLFEFLTRILKLPQKIFGFMHAPESIIQSPLVLLLIFSIFTFYKRSNYN